MTEPNDVIGLLRILGAHPVLPPMDRLPPNTEALHAFLAELSRGERSIYAEMLRRVAAECGISYEELARRAEFLLACLILPRTGTLYEMLGVAPDATAEEIRERWASLMHRYHPDRLGGNGGWLAGQARQLIEAYQTLKDPDRRRRYDAVLARERAAINALNVPRRSRRVPPRTSSMRWRWVPLTVVLSGLMGVIGSYVWYTPQPLPRAALPPAAKSQETRQPPVISKPIAPPEVHKTESAVAEKPSRPALAVDPAPPPLLDGRPARTSTAPTRPKAAASPFAATHGVASLTAVIDEAVRPSSTQEAAPAAVTRTSPLPPPAVSPALVALASPPLRESLPAPVTAPPADTGSASAEDVAAPALAVARTDQNHTRSETMPAGEAPLALIEMFRAAYERKDLGAVMELLAAVPRERDEVGRSAVQALYARNFAALDQIRYELTQLVAMTLSEGSTPLVHGRFRIRAVRRNSPSRPLDVAGVIRWRLLLEADGLRIAEIQYEVTPP